jgi:2-polyprenyl-6-methoxyphenol hydroxylase-like FAD-dependent oxidoreductase
VKPEYDVIIVGARIAGSILSILLGQEGRRILLLDRASFPSDTLSTHFFRWPALQAFRQVGLLGKVEATAPPMPQLYNYIDGHFFSEPVQGKHGLDYFLCVRRITLDSILNTEVLRREHITFRPGARLDELTWEQERVTGVMFQDSEGRHSASARVVVGADGFYSRIAQLVDAPFEHYQDVQRAMYYAYFENLGPLPGPAAEHHFRGNHLVYVFPTDARLTLVAATIPLSEFTEFRRDPAGRLMAELESLPTLAPRMPTARRASQVKGSANIPCYQRIPYGNGWVLVGDAGQVMDPWSGQGIDHASTHAVMLAEALGSWLDGKSSWQAAMGGYHGERNAWSKKTYQRTSTYAADLQPMTEAALKRRGLAARG